MPSSFVSLLSSSFFPLGLLSFVSPSDSVLEASFFIQCSPRLGFRKYWGEVTSGQDALEQGEAGNDGYQR